MTDANPAPAGTVAPATPPAQMETGDGQPQPLYCANHPGVETLLRCNRCGKPICLKCAVLTDVGYRCKECIRGVQSSYFNALPLDNLIAFGVALVVTALASPLATLVFGMFGFWGLILAFMVGTAAGSVLGQIVRAAVGRRRGRQLPYFALAGIILGILVGGAAGLLFGLSPLNIGQLIFAVLAATAAYQFLR
ncbi:MAG: hypothetical protein IT329_17685 [Caldilineaceae bacterium]|nr:hypothetical protein [Caldilineaceae bacterium]